MAESNHSLPPSFQSTDALLTAYFKAQDRIKELEQASLEIVICAAIRLPNGKLFLGHRHHDCIRTADEFVKWRAKNGEQVYVDIDAGPDAFGDQGFITSRNRYVDRQEGMRLQLAAGIESKSADGRGYRGTTLFSEDLC